MRKCQTAALAQNEPDSNTSSHRRPAARQSSDREHPGAFVGRHGLPDNVHPRHRRNPHKRSRHAVKHHKEGQQNDRPVGPHRNREQTDQDPGERPARPRIREEFHLPRHWLDDARDENLWPRPPDAHQRARQPDHHARCRQCLNKRGQDKIRTHERHSRVHRRTVGNQKPETPSDVLPLSQLLHTILNRGLLDGRRFTHLRPPRSPPPVYATPGSRAGRMPPRSGTRFDMKSTLRARHRESAGSLRV